MCLFIYKKIKSLIITKLLLILIFYYGKELAIEIREKKMAVIHDKKKTFNQVTSIYALSLNLLICLFVSLSVPSADFTEVLKLR